MEEKTDEKNDDVGRMTPIVYSTEATTLSPLSLETPGSSQTPSDLPSMTPLGRPSPSDSNYSSTKKSSFRRVSTAQCIETGKTGAVTDIEVEVLQDSTREPMDPHERRRRELKNKLKGAGKSLFKAAAETVIAEKRVEKQSSSDNVDDNEKTCATDMFRNVAHEVVAKNRLRDMFHRHEEPERQHILHGRLSVQTSHHGGAHGDDDRSSSNNSSNNSLCSDNVCDGEEYQRKKTKQKKKKDPHYRLALHKKPPGNFCVRLLRAVGISAGSDGIYDTTGGGNSCRCFGIAPNQMVTSYLHWTFRTSFVTYFLSAFLSFICLTVFFALLSWWLGTHQPECIHVNGKPFGTESAWGDFLDAYALSWTTFSTVGYGLIFPATSAVVDKHHACQGISALMTLESFVGILFSSFTGAIVFSKITRVRSQAQVAFSDPIVIKFGTGLFEEGDDSTTNVSGSRGSGGGSHGGMLEHGPSPFPVLEFQVVNRLHSSMKGEIMDCVMQIVASIDARHADPTFQRMAGHMRRRKGKKRVIRRPSKAAELRKSSSFADVTNDTIKETKAHTFTEIGRTKSNVTNASDPLSADAVERLVTRRRKHTAFDEEIGGKLVPRRIFSKLEIDGGPDHPFFKRVWCARHTLDLHSPLLTPEARQRIRLNGGRWPPEFNTYESIRAAVSFDQILVSFSGTSNVDANSVYAQKVYEYGDINVGYSFVPMLYRDFRDGSLKVDLTLLNDVVEQYGGGGEPLTGIEEHDFDDHLQGIVVL